MDYFTVIYQSLFSIFALFLLTKIMGCRQVSNLSMFDYINSITIGSIAAEMAMNTDSDYLKPLVAMIVYAAFSIFLSKISQKSVFLRRIINGKANVLYLHDKFYRNNIKKARMELNELLMECRVNGYFDLSQIEAIILEPNGKISILPKTEHAPATPKQLDIVPSQEELFTNLIMDGKILKTNLKTINKDDKWIMQQLKIHNISDITDVFLATCDQKNNFFVYPKINASYNKDTIN